MHEGRLSRNRCAERPWFQHAQNPLVAVGTTIADRPPHRSVRARSRIRLLPRMSSGTANTRVRARMVPRIEKMECNRAQRRAIAGKRIGWLARGPVSERIAGVVCALRVLLLQR